MNAIIAEAIKFLASVLIGSLNFERILASVERWAETQKTGAEKRAGVLAELEVIGVDLAESLARLGLELAVTYQKKVTK